jgi:ABC-type transport system substrate-binding protein
VNFAIDRAALRLAAGSVYASVLADQYLPPSIPGFKNASIYPLRRPDLRQARALARGHTRSGKAVLYILDQPDRIALAQIVKRDLARIGLDVEIRAIPGGAYFDRLGSADEPFDIAYFNWAADYLDPYAYINVPFDGRFIGAQNVARFDSAKYNRLMRRAARLQGGARYRAYGDLDVQLARDAAPFVATEYFNVPTLVSRRVDPRCIVLRPGLDLTAVCLKR